MKVKVLCRTFEYLYDTWISYFRLSSTDNECIKMPDIINNIPLYWTCAQGVGNGFCSSVVEYWSSNPEDAGLIPSRKSLELHFFRNWSQFGSYNIYLYDTRISYAKLDFHLLTTSVNAKLRRRFVKTLRRIKTQVCKNICIKTQVCKNSMSEHKTGTCVHSKPEPEVNRWKSKFCVGHLSIFMTLEFPTELLCIKMPRTCAQGVGNGFCSSVVEHWSSNPEDMGLIPSRKALELHFFRNWSQFGSHNIYLYDTRISYTKLWLSSTDNKCKCQILLIIYPEVNSSSDPMSKWLPSIPIQLNTDFYINKPVQSLIQLHVRSAMGLG